MTFPTLPPLAWLTLSALLFAAGEYLSKKFVLSHGVGTLLLLLCMYCLGSLAWLPALMAKKDLSVTGTLWSILSLVLTVLIGVLLFQERLTTLRILGILCAVLAIIFLSIA